MTKIFFLTLILLVSLDAADAQSRSEKILVFAGAASKPATEEAVLRFTTETAIPVDVAFGGSGYVLSQMKLSRKGDLYFPGSSDFMEMAKREEWVFADSEKVIAYLIPAMNVQRGNPKRISALRDLTREGIRVGIAHPEKVCVGTYAVEIVEKNLSSPDKEKFRKNIVNYVESCEKTANVIALKAVDAVLGWSVFQDWNPGRIETVYLRPEEIPRIGYLPIAISRFSKDRRLAQRFIDFLTSRQGKDIFRKHGYLMEPQGARRFTLPTTPIGGEYSLPPEWRGHPSKETKR